MPKYSFVCNNCNFKFSKIISFNEIKKLSCEECRDKDLERIFNFVGQRVERNQDQRLEIIKREAKIIAKKIKLGDQNAIKEIYGGNK